MPHTSDRTTTEHTQPAPEVPQPADAVPRQHDRRYVIVPQQGPRIRVRYCEGSATQACLLCQTDSPSI